MQWNNQLNGKLTQTFCFSIFSKPDSKLQNDNEEKNKFRIKLERKKIVCQVIPLDLM